MAGRSQEGASGARLVAAVSVPGDTTGDQWAPTESPSFSSFRSILLGPSNNISVFKQLGGNGRATAAKERSGPYLDLLEKNFDEPKPPGSPLELETGNYGLAGMAVWRAPCPDVEPGRMRFEVLVGVVGEYPTRRFGQLPGAGGPAAPTRNLRQKNGAW